MRSDDRVDSESQPESESPRLPNQALIGAAFKESLAMLLEVGRWQLCALVVMTLLRGLLPGLQVYAVGSLVSAISRGDLSIHGEVALPLMLIGSSMIGAYVLENVIRYVGERLTVHLSLKTDISTVEKLTQFEVADFENAETFDGIK